MPVNHVDIHITEQVLRSKPRYQADSSLPRMMMKSKAMLLETYDIILNLSEFYLIMRQKMTFFEPSYEA